MQVFCSFRRSFPTKCLAFDPLDASLQHLTTVVQRPATLEITVSMYRSIAQEV